MGVEMKNIRLLAVLSLIGSALGFLLIIAFSMTGWGVPGTAAYRTYELLNRLMAIALLLMAAGWAGAWQALAGYGHWAGYPFRNPDICPGYGGRILALL